MGNGIGGDWLQVRGAIDMDVRGKSRDVLQLDSLGSGISP
jgi:hypothetical protein